jgi:competence protein ComGC
MNTRTLRRSTLLVPRSALESAFTRAELLITLAVLSLLVAIVLPALAYDRAGSARIICANNLRQIGAAMQVWGNDHGDRPPYEVEMAEGGTRRHPLAANTWFHFAWMSNELASPKILLCPSDTGTPATEFSGDPTKGYLNPNFANRATSYFLTYRFDASSHGLMAGDRNIRAAGFAGCSIFNTAVSIPARPTSRAYGWTNGLHESSGNYLTYDGGVEQVTGEQFSESLTSSGVQDNGSLHFSLPR